MADTSGPTGGRHPGGLDPGGSRVGAGDEISYHFLHCGLSMLLNHREIKPQLSHAVKWTSE